MGPRTPSKNQRRPSLGVALAALAGAFFGLGVLVTRLLAPSPPPAALAPTPPPVAPGSGVGLGLGGGPRILIDQASVDLLPDAALQLRLPPGFDASTGGPARDR